MANKETSHETEKFTRTPRRFSVSHNLGKFHNKYIINILKTYKIILCCIDFFGFLFYLFLIVISIYYCLIILKLVQIM